VFQELGTPGALPTWDKAAIQQMLQGLSGYQDVPRLASDVEEVVREIRSLQPKVDSLGMRKFMYHLCLWRRPALLTFAPLALVRADARPPALLAIAPLALVLADARPPALLACAPLALVRPPVPAPLAPAPSAPSPPATALNGRAFFSGRSEQ
jgi:hypothetical protein